MKMQQWAILCNIPFCCLGFLFDFLKRRILNLLKQALILSLPSVGLGFNISVYICKSEFRTSRRKHLVCYRQKLSTSCVPCTVKNYIYSVRIHAYPICVLKIAR